MNTEKSSEEIAALLKDRERLEWLLRQNRADVMWDTREEVDTQMADDVPADFKEGMRDIAAGRTVDMETALTATPTAQTAKTLGNL